MLRTYQKGQIGLMLLVVMGVVVSLVLSIASRSFADITLSRQERENNASFAIAESGVEEALLRVSGGTYTGVYGLSDSESFITGNYGITPLASYDLYVEEGETAQIDLTGAPVGLVVQWEQDSEDPGTCQEGSGLAPAALELNITNASDQVARAYYNAYNCDLSGDNNFAVAESDPGGTYNSNQSVSVTGGDKYLRIKPLYNGTTVNVTGSGLASQLYLIESQAASGDVRSDIEVKRSRNAPGSIFDYALFSKTTIIK